MCDYSDAVVFVSWTITITGEATDDAGKQMDEREKG